MYESKIYCINCGKKREYRIFDKLIHHVVRDTRFSCLEKQAFCIECGNQIYVPEINDENVEVRLTAYNEARGGSDENTSKIYTS